MRLRPPLRVSVTRHEEKEQKLQEFIYQHLAGAQPGGDARHATQLLIIARSLESHLTKKRILEIYRETLDRAVLAK